MQLEDLKRVRQNSVDVETYYKLRRSRYGIDAALPAEFLPTYQGLRSRDYSRFYYVERGVCFLLKKIRLYNVQFNRLEGLPISLNGDDAAERSVLKELLECPWLHKVHCCDGEVPKLQQYGNFKYVREDVVANFWSDIDIRIEKTSKNSWSGRNPLNWATKNEGLKFRRSEQQDTDELLKLYESWEAFKSENEKVIRTDLYQGILRDHFHHTPQLINYVMHYGSRLISFSTCAIVGEDAHLLANIAISRTHGDYSNMKKVVDYMGQLSNYFLVRELKTIGVNRMLSGYCEEGDSLIQYKRTHSDGETVLTVATIHDPPKADKSKPKEEPHGFF